LGLCFLYSGSALLLSDVVLIRNKSFPGIGADSPFLRPGVRILFLALVNSVDPTLNLHLGGKIFRSDGLYMYPVLKLMYVVSYRLALIRALRSLICASLVVFARRCQISIILALMFFRYRIEIFLVYPNRFFSGPASISYLG